MVLSPALITRLLGALETDSLVFLCGAGLSIPMPTLLPSALEVSRICYDKWLPNEMTLDPGFRENIDLLAGHFHGRGDFSSIFIRLVPWDELVGTPNKGHETIADLLITRAAHAAVSANFDPAIEHWAQEHKVFLQGALTGQEAVTFSALTSPLLKFHGCMQRDQNQTLWTQRQLTDATIQLRVQSCKDWMTLNLPGRDLVVVGFWTDWGYLNNVLADAFTIANARSVTVIDPKSLADLQSKAPVLWSKLTALSLTFEHVQESADEALEEIRTEYSRAWARKYYAGGVGMLQSSGATVAVAAPFDSLSVGDLYNLRRDAEGRPYTRAATQRAPATGTRQAAYLYALLLNAGALQEGAWLKHDGKSIRIVNGAGQGLADVRESYKEPPSLPQSEVVVCAGATNFGVPGRLIASGVGASTIRPSPGGGASWLTFDDAVAAFAL